jgi:hypothetical protein
MEWTTGVPFPTKAGIFLFATASTPALFPTHLGALPDDKMAGA